MTSDHLSVSSSSAASTGSEVAAQSVQSKGSHLSRWSRMTQSMLQSVETVFGTGGSRHHNDYLVGEIVSRIIPLPLGLESGSVSRVFCHMIIISTDFNCVRLQYELSWVPTAQPCTERSSLASLGYFEISGGWSRRGTTFLSELETQRLDKGQYAEQPFDFHNPDTKQRFQIELRRGQRKERSIGLSVREYSY
jgi:hypothetical protein